MTRLVCTDETMSGGREEALIHDFDGFYEFETALAAAVESGDVVAACEMVLADKEGIGTSENLKSLPENIRLPMLEAFTDLYESAGSTARRESILLTHALLSFSLGRPDDRLASARQKALKAVPRRRYGIHFAVEMAWVELASGRGVPVDFGAEMRRADAAGNSFKVKELKKTAPMLDDHHPPLNEGQPWTDRALAELAELPAAWTDLVGHAVTARASRPSAAWERKGRALLAALDAEAFRDRSLDWLSLASDPRTVENFDDHNYFATRGLVWLLSFLPEDPRTVRGLGSVLEESLRKAPGIGPALPKLANACANALGAMEGQAALAELARLTTRVTYKSTLRLLEKAVDAWAQALNVSREELGEPAVPACAGTTPPARG